MEPEVRYHIHSSPQLVPVVCQVTPIYTAKLFFYVG